MRFTKHSIKCIAIYFNALFSFIVVLSIFAFARPNTVCNGKEFNRRVKTLIDGGDVAIDYKATRFERGDNPPTDSSYYIDVSEDNDESVIVYYTIQNMNSKTEIKSDTPVNLYWYATDTIFINEYAAFMFQGFSNIKYIDLTGFSFFQGLDDTRYMFKDCRHLSNLHLSPTAYNPAEGKQFTPTEVQGMFYGCQSLKEIDLTCYNTYLVTNMSDMFCKCYNLRNIYVDKTNWNIVSVNNFNRMFSECHLLLTNKGKKAVDVPDDDYEKYANIGTDSVEGFVKDTISEYTSYISDDAYVPIDGQGFLMDVPPEPIDEYGEEPENDGDGSDKYQNNAGNANDETGVVVNAPTAPNNQVVSNASADASKSYSANSTQEAIKVLENVTSAIESQQDNTNVVEQESAGVTETVEEGSGKKIIELDEYLNADGDKNRQNKNIIEVLWEDYQPLLITLLISIFVLLLLIGMLLYLYKEKKSTKNDDKGI